MIQLIKTVSGNCNFAYLSGLRPFANAPEKAMADFLTLPKTFGSTKAKQYQNPINGIILFAQGSDDSPVLDPYAPNFKAYIEKEGLGTVTAFPAKNPQHYGNIGIMYVWVINSDACLAWWEKNVRDKP